MSPRHIYTQNKVSMCLSPHLCVTVIIPVHCPNGILLDVLGVLVLICMCFFRGGCITISFDRVCPLQGCSTREYIPGFSWLSPIAYYTCLYMYICTYIYIHLMIVWWYSHVLWWKHLLYLGIRWSDTWQNMTCSKTCSNTNWWFQPPWKIWKSVESILPNIWKVIKFMFQITNQNMFNGDSGLPTAFNTSLPAVRRDEAISSCRFVQNRRAESQFHQSQRYNQV